MFVHESNKGGMLIKSTSNELTIYIWKYNQVDVRNRVCFQANCKKCNTCYFKLIYGMCNS